MTAHSDNRTTSVHTSSNQQSQSTMSNPNHSPSIRIPVECISSERGSALIDVSLLSQGDLGALKKQDPFLYHSIPAVHKAFLALKDVELHQVTESRPAIVPRKSRVATECHVSLLLEDILDDGELSQATHGEDHELDLSDDVHLDLFLFLGMPPCDDNDKKDLAK